MEGEEIMVPCKVCLEHKTMLGELESAVRGAINSSVFQDLNLDIDQRLDLGKEMFIQSQLNRRTNVIQDYKKENMRSFKK